jgi:hypothetical protein
MHHVARIVVVHSDLFEDDAALVLDVLAPEQRRSDHVADHVDGQRQVGVQHPGVVAGVLLGGERVQLTADRVERGRDLQRVPPGGALEQQVLEVMGGTGLHGSLIPRTDADPYPERHGPNGRHRLGDDAQATG